MNGEDMLGALGMIGEEWLMEAQKEAPLRKRKLYRLRLVAAACAAAVVVGVCGVWYHHASHEKLPLSAIRFPSQNAVCKQISPGCISAAIHRYDYRDLAQASDIVIVADVTKVQAYSETVRFSHVAATSVIQVLKGDVIAGDTVFVRDNNFGETHTTDGGLMLEKGNRVLLFLTKQTPKYSLSGQDEYTYVYGGTGKFFFDNNGQYIASAAFGERFDSDFSLWAKSELVDYSPKSIDEIMRLV